MSYKSILNGLIIFGQHNYLVNIYQQVTNILYILCWSNIFWWNGFQPKYVELSLRSYLKKLIYKSFLKCWLIVFQHDVLPAFGLITICRWETKIHYFMCWLNVCWWNCFQPKDGELSLQSNLKKLIYKSFFETLAYILPT